MTKDMEGVLTQSQFDLCKSQANQLAKILMEQNVSDIFGDNGNANFCLNTLVILVSGTLTLLAKEINCDTETIVKIFNNQVSAMINS